MGSERRFSHSHVLPMCIQPAHAVKHNYSHTCFCRPISCRFDCRSAESWRTLKQSHVAIGMRTCDLRLPACCSHCRAMIRNVTGTHKFGKSRHEVDVCTERPEAHDRPATFVDTPFPSNVCVPTTLVCVDRGATYTRRPFASIRLSSHAGNTVLHNVNASRN